MPRARTRGTRSWSSHCRAFMPWRKWKQSTKLLLSYVLFILAGLSLGHLISLVLPVTENTISHKGLGREDTFSAGSAPCEILHIITACHGAGDAREFVQMFKTVLFHRKTPLFLHLVVDSFTENALSGLMASWELPQVDWKIYLLNVSEISIPQFLFMLPSILPGSVAKVVYFNPRMRILNDINELWSQFAEFRKNMSFGLVANQSPKSSKLQIQMALYNIRSAIFHVSCDWNLQIVEDTLPQCARNKTSRFGGITAASLPQRFSGKPVIETIRQRLQHFRELDGDIFRIEPICSSLSGEKEADLPAGGKCSHYRYGASLSRRLHLGFWPQEPVEQTVSKYSVTALVQFTADRMYMFVNFVKNWKGPVIAVLHATDSEIDKIMFYIETSQTLQMRNDVEYHVVYRRQYYPINYLRNVAINLTRTPYLVSVDVDLAPIPDLYDKLCRAAELYLEGRPNRHMEDVPSTKEELLELIALRKVDGYRMQRKWNFGHKATRYDLWVNATRPYKVNFTDAFEPYVLLPTKTAPLYDTRLLERMGDKISYGLELYARGFEFFVMDDVFLIHMPHPISDGTFVWKSSKLYLRCGKILFLEFKADLKKRFPSYEPLPPATRNASADANAHT